MVRGRSEGGTRTVEGGLYLGGTRIPEVSSLRSDVPRHEGDSGQGWYEGCTRAVCGWYEGGTRVV